MSEESSLCFPRPFVKPSTLTRGGGLSPSLSELGPLDLRRWDDGEEGVGGGAGVERAVSLGGFVMVGELSNPLVLPSVVPTYCN